MKIVLAGGSGFLGRALTDTLAADGHDLVVLTRGSAGPAAGVHLRHVQWTGDTVGPWTAELDGADAVVNLAGESIAGGRWSTEQKTRIEESRIRATRTLADTIAAAAAPPPVLISGSAVGYYGPCDDRVLTEDAPPGSDFLARLCVKWEAEARRAASARTRVVCVRTGLVLDRHGGALATMLRPFQIGIGGRAGTGRQYWPWIHIRDWVDLVCWAIATPTVTGPLNATAPNPVTNADFTQALGRALHRPTLIPAPGFALRLLMGEMADALLLSGQRAIPAKAQALWFGFHFPHVDDALRDILG